MAYLLEVELEPNVSYGGNVWHTQAHEGPQGAHKVSSMWPTRCLPCSNRQAHSALKPIYGDTAGAHLVEAYMWWHRLQEQRHFLVQIDIEEAA